MDCSSREKAIALPSSTVREVGQDFRPGSIFWYASSSFCRASRAIGPGSSFGWYSRQSSMVLRRVSANAGGSPTCYVACALERRCWDRNAGSDLHQQTCTHSSGILSLSYLVHHSVLSIRAPRSPPWHRVRIFWSTIDHSSTACYQNSNRRRALDRAERSQAAGPRKSQKD